MVPSRRNPGAESVLQATLGYLNFSSGVPDGGFRRSLNQLYAEAEARTADGAPPAWRSLYDLLMEHTVLLQSASPAFREVEQARAVLRLVFDHVLPEFRRRHRDLLHHQTDEELFRPFFLARACETVLQMQPPWEETDRVVSGALDRLNDFLGYRPVAVLRDERRMEPYPNEWVAVTPLYFRDAGVAVGRYAAIVSQALEILQQTDSDVLHQAAFDPQHLEELALDPRAYDFDHPINKRPNYHFGQWDPTRIDNSGRYTRFVLQQVTLDALLARVEEAPEDQREGHLWEAAAVLAGTMLMASAVSGAGPDWYDSFTSLAALMPKIAAFRDEFYTQLLLQCTGPHGEALREEAKAMRQPFGGARQDLNQRLARLRASQLQHVHLAQLFARMGYSDASLRQAEIVPVASARMLCEINRRLTAGRLALDRGKVVDAARIAPDLVDVLHRAIECGAMVDPWNILGFQGQFSLFPALENSVRDHRVDVLLHVMDQIFALFVRLCGEAAAAGERALLDDLKRLLDDLAEWWDRFASVEVSSVDGVSGEEAVESASAVSAALAAWHEAGAAAGDIAFWRGHVERFESPKAYYIVVAALLDKRDFVAAMALLMQWLSVADVVPLEENSHSFHDLVVRWLLELRGADLAPVSGEKDESDRRWRLVKKFVDFLEPNAGDNWETPRLIWEEISADPDGLGDLDDFDEELDQQLGDFDDDEETDGLSAFEGPFFGEDEDGGTIEYGAPSEGFELEGEHQRIGLRLDFLCTVARFWSLAAATDGVVDGEGDDRSETLRGWLARAQDNRAGLLELLDAVHRHEIAFPTGAHESMVENDRRRRIKDSLAGQIVAAIVETAGAARMIMAALDEPAACDAAPWERQAVALLAAVLRQDPEAARRCFGSLRDELAGQQILYVPLVKGGDPARLADAQSLKSLVAELLAGLPRLGLLAETCELIATVEEMERSQPRNEGAITEYNRLFKIGYQSLVEALVESARRWEAGEVKRGRAAPAPYNADLVDCLQMLTEPLLRRWLDHSKSVRLSVMEGLADDSRWESLVHFIERYGHDLFVPRFMNMGNLRAILNNTVGAYLDALIEEPDPLHPVRLVEELDAGISREEAERLLAICLEAVVENFSEFKDYNTTTTQSDRGELLYTLLDFLRLKASYERFAWNIRPIGMAHETLVRRQRTGAAELWRRAAAERTAEVADWHLKRLAELEQRYRMRLPTVSDRLAERFMRPLVIDRLRALVRPAMEEACAGGETPAFTLLEQEIAELTERPTGSGLDVPAWLVALEQEAAATARLLIDSEEEDHRGALPRIVFKTLPLEEVRRQLGAWDS